MRLCEEHRLGGIPALGKLDGVCVGCAVETKLHSAANECQEHITEDRGRIADLEETLRALIPHHSGSCCTFNAEKKVIVTRESCKCVPVVLRARLALAEWG